MKTKSKIFLISGMAVVFAAIVALTVYVVLILNAKPEFGAAKYRHMPEKNIMAYTFDGMSFEPAMTYAARNYPEMEDDYGHRSREATLWNTVNSKIELGLVDYLNERYNEYFVDAIIIENTREKSVFKFDGDAVPIDGGERKIIKFNLTIDWNKVIENNGDDFIEITTKLPYEEA